MIQFKKKVFLIIFALGLATIAALADAYKNSIMALEFEPAENNAVNMVLQTKTAYVGNVSPSKVDANTYVLMLPETNSSAATPDWSNVGGISSVKIRTMPYSGDAKGYTKITVKTTVPIKLAGKNVIYTNTEPSASEANRNTDINERVRTNSARNGSRTYEGQRESAYREGDSELNPQRTVRKNSNANQSGTATQKRVTEPISRNITQERTTQNVISDESTNSDEKLMLVLGVLAIIAASAFFYVRAKDRLTEISGERMNIDLEDETKTSSQEKKHGNIRSTIKTLDKAYSKPIKMPVLSEYTQPAPSMSSEKTTDDMNIVDLDELFKEQIKNQDEQSEDNNALEDFLTNFVFEEVHQEKNNSNQLDEDIYDKIIANRNIKFSKSDEECINQILSVEIDDNTIRNIDKYAVSNPSKQKPRKTLEEIATNYTISQNIIFTKDDLKILDKIMKVEIDSDFVTDLKTDPSRTAEMERQILEFQNSDLKTQGEIVTLKVADLLPNLEDVAAHPDKYIEPEPEKIVIDADVLLKNIENVTFKPFDDGTRDFEILNHFDEEREENVIELYSSDFSANKKKEMPETTEQVKETLQVKADLAQENRQEKVSKQKPPVEKKIESTQQKKAHVLPNTSVKNNRVRPERPAIVRPEANNTKAYNPQSTVKCIMNGRTYNVLSSAAFNEYSGCHLAKGEDNYIVLSYYKNKLAILKEYKDLKSEKIQARLSDKLSNGVLRYIIRIGTVKFIADYSDGSTAYVMDL